MSEAKSIRNEREHLLGLLNAHLGYLKNKNLSGKEVIASLKQWIDSRAALYSHKENNHD